MAIVAITRATPGAHETAALVRARGHDAIVAPLLHTVPCAFDTDFTGTAALAFTSSAGVRAFAAQCGVRSLPAYCVGDVTASAARNAGFARVHGAGGDVAALASLIAAAQPASAGMITHMSGADIAGDLVARLAALGYRAERRVAYKAEAAHHLPEALAAVRYDAILFHSPRGAQTYLALGAPHAGTLIAGCFSAAVADAASDRGRVVWARIAVAPAPTDDALLRATLTGENTSAGASA